MAWFQCLYCSLWTYLTPCSCVSIVNFGHVIAGWERHQFNSDNLKDIDDVINGKSRVFGELLFTSFRKGYVHHCLARGLTADTN